MDAGPPTLAGVVRSLRASEEVTSLVTESAHREEALGVLGPGPVAWAVQAVQENIPAAAPPFTLLASPDVTLHRSAEVLLLGILLELFGGPPAETFFAGVHQQRSRLVTRAGVPLEARIEVARRLQELWTQRLLDHALARDAPKTVLRDIAVVVGACIDRFVDVVSQRGRTESDRVVAEQARRRRRLVEALVDGEQVDPDDAVDLLDVDLGHHHLAMVLTPRGEQPLDEHDVLRAVDRAVARLTAPSVVRHAVPGSTALWVWVSSPHRVDAAAVDLAAFADADVHLGVGTAHRGPDGFRRSHLEAVDAERIARGPHGPTTRHDQAPLSALLSLDLERARWFVHDQLGSLAEPGPAMAELRTTLRTLYDSGMRLATTAARMHLHRNTLIRRLERIEKLLGRRVNDRVAETQGAIQLVEDLGEQVLGRPPSVDPVSAARPPEAERRRGAAARSRSRSTGR